VSLKPHAFSPIIIPRSTDKIGGFARRSGPNAVLGALLLLIAGGYQFGLACPKMRYLVEYRNGKSSRVPYGERTRIGVFIHYRDAVVNHHEQQLFIAHQAASSSENNFAGEQNKYLQ